MKQSDPRHLARILVIQKLFQKAFIGNEHVKEVKEYSDSQIAGFNEFGKYDKELVKTLLEGVESSKDKADDVIKKFAKEWPINQINTVDLQILRLAIFEGFLSKRVPQKVAIDEAIELAKELGGPNSAKFINGVLGNLIENNKKN